MTNSADDVKTSSKKSSSVSREEAVTCNSDGVAVIPLGFICNLARRLVLIDASDRSRHIASGKTLLEIFVVRGVECLDLSVFVDLELEIVVVLIRYLHLSETPQT